MNSTPAPDQVETHDSCEPSGIGAIRSVRLNGPAGRLEAVQRAMAEWLKEQLP